MSNANPKVIENSRALVVKIAEALKERNVDNELTTDLDSILKTMKKSIDFSWSHENRSNWDIRLHYFEEKATPS